MCFRAFPTRRSSDLKRMGRVNLERAMHVRIAVGHGDNFIRLAVEFGHRRHRAQSPISDRRRRESHLPDAIAVVEARDRKSTRLNSSHTVISYAVFCLTTAPTCASALSLHDALPI